jgi:hypothetical protein
MVQESDRFWLDADQRNRYLLNCCGELGYFTQLERAFVDAWLGSGTTLARGGADQGRPVGSRATLTGHVHSTAGCREHVRHRFDPPVSIVISGGRAQIAWTVALIGLAAASAVSAELHGHDSRRHFTPPEDFRGHRWAMVQDAAAAVDFWSASGVHGRQVLVLSGRWGKPVPQDGAAPSVAPGTADPAARAVERAGLVSGALFEATMRGLARELLVVMPPAAFDARVAAIRTSREARVGAGWASQTYHGIPRGFFLAERLPRPGEEVLLLVEPSFFAAGAPTDLTAWLEQKGIRFDLALIAAQDPEATAAQQEEALALASRVGAVQVEVAQ